MFDIAPTEFILIAIIALIVIGPKDLPKAMRLVGYWVGRARGVARQFRSGFDTMIREAELQEMEKRWAEENARIMADHPNNDTSTPATRPPDHADALTEFPAEHAPAEESPALHLHVEPQRGLPDAGSASGGEASGRAASAGGAVDPPEPGLR